MTSIKTKDCPIHFNSVAYEQLNEHLAVSKYSRIAIIVDTNTHDACLPIFLKKIESKIEFDIIQIKAGETEKNISTCNKVWLELSNLGFDRKSLIINLGGGVVTDLGGFVACTFKRGLDYINVPTSLLAMVDASVGGKTGVDLGSLKNQIGVISVGEMVLIDTDFLHTLPENQFRSGLSEMLKHGLIHSRDYWKAMISVSNANTKHIDELIYDSVVIKNTIVEEDPNENGIRKFLNFGHTLGHAIESYFIESENKEDLLHGEAIAIGMVLESYLSHKILELSKRDVDEIKRTFINMFGKVEILENDYLPIIELLKFDKKNSHGNINFVLLEDIGKPQYDCQVPNNLILEAFSFYNS